MNILIATLALTTVHSTQVGTQGPIQSYEGCPLYLGSGLNRADPLHSFACPVDTSVAAQPFDGEAQQVSCSSEQVNSYQELLRDLRIDAKASAKTLFFSGSAEFHLHDHEAFSSNSITWVLHAYQDFGRYGYKTTPFLKELRALTPDQLSKVYGTEYVYAVRKACFVAAVFTLKNVNSEKLHELSAKVEAAGKIGIVGGKVSAEYSSMLSEITRNGLLSCSFYSVGGPGLAKASQMITNKGDVDSFKSTVESYVSGVSAANAAPIEYFTRDYQEVIQTAEKYVPSRLDALVESAYYAYLDAKDCAEVCRNVLKDTRNGGSYLTEGEISTVKKKQKEAETRISEIVDTVAKWKQEPSNLPLNLSWETLDFSIPQPMIWILDDWKNVPVDAIRCDAAQGERARISDEIDNAFSGGSTGPTLNGQVYNMGAALVGIVPYGRFTSVQKWKGDVMVGAEPLYLDSKSGRKYFFVPLGQDFQGEHMPCTELRLGAGNAGAYLKIPVDKTNIIRVIWR